jgi:L-histidine N-alpha-methyltransferase
MNGTVAERSEIGFEMPGMGQSYIWKGNLQILNYLNGDHREKMLDDILEGMTKRQKSIPAKYFYDARGSRLFDQICMTPEYYPTKTELSILGQSAAGIMQFFLEEGGDLIELGSGSNQKIRKLLDGMPRPGHSQARYIPVDISRTCLIESAGELLEDHENLIILGILADFTRHLCVLPRGKKLLTFFGGTIGNFTEREALNFLRSVRGIMNRDDRFLLGMDMVKPIELIEAAYNDRQGVTCDFNRNILAHIDRELGADFDPEDFEHLAFFNTGTECVEMHLKARRNVTARIEDLGLSVEIKKGETIHTEISRKFSREGAQRLFQEAGLSVSRWFTDSRGWFSVVELEANGIGKRHGGSRGF